MHNAEDTFHWTVGIGVILCLLGDVDTAHNLCAATLKGAMEIGLQISQAGEGDDRFKTRLVLIQ
jgi:hypothetical protein